MAHQVEVAEASGYPENTQDPAPPSFSLDDAVLEVVFGGGFESPSFHAGGPVNYPLSQVILAHVLLVFEKRKLIICAIFMIKVTAYAPIFLSYLTVEDAPPRMKVFASCRKKARSRSIAF